jgi:hypothetical protein
MIACKNSTITSKCSPVPRNIRPEDIRTHLKSRIFSNRGWELTPVYIAPVDYDFRPGTIALAIITVRGIITIVLAKGLYSRGISLRHVF